DMSVQHRNRAKALEVAEGLRAVIRAPAPLRIDAPQRYVGKHHDRHAFGEMLYIALHPLQLLLPQVAKPAGLEVHYVHQPAEVDALVIKAIPARSLVAVAVALKILFPVVADHLVLSRDVENVLRAGALQDLLGIVEFFRLGEMADVAGVQDEARLSRQSID